MLSHCPAARLHSSLPISPVVAFSPTILQILQHPWMKMDVAAIPDVDLASSLAQLKRYQARRRLKKAINVVRLTVRTRLLFAARAAKAAKESGADPDAVENAFFDAARKLPSTRHAPGTLSPYVGLGPGVPLASGGAVPGYPAPVPYTSPRPKVSQPHAKINALVANTKDGGPGVVMPAVEVRGAQRIV